MDHDNPVAARWRLAGSEIQALTDPLRIGSQTSAALKDYIAFVTRGDRHIQISDPLVRAAYRVSLLTRNYPVESGYDPDRASWYQQVDDLAQAIDIYSRLAPTEARAYQRLSAHLYMAAQQPTKAARVARELRPVRATTGNLTLDDELVGVVAELSSLGGHATLEQARRSLRELVIGAFDFEHPEGFDPIQAILDLSFGLSDANLHQMALEARFAARFRGASELAAITEEFPDSFVQQCTTGGPRHRRAELLPSQSWALDRGLLDTPVVSVSTPTGSGKTFMAELRIAHEFLRRPDGLAVYVAPFNALAGQVEGQMRERLAAAGWPVTLWTGAYELDDSVENLGSILVTTPEKLDYILRSHLEDDDRFTQLKDRATAFVFDESDLINQGTRGIGFEFLLRRIRSLFPDAGVMTISAVQEGVESFSRWIAGPDDESTAVTVSWTPTKLVDLLWRQGGALEARDDPQIRIDLPRPASAKQAAALLIATILGRLRSVLAVETRKDWAESLASELYHQYGDNLRLRLARTESVQTDARSLLRALADAVRRQVHPRYPLADYIELGLAFHHAGLPPRIRREIERLAEREIIHTLVATTTLAEGADLPFRAVVLVHLNFQSDPIPTATLRNIRGRAGRPFYANEGLFVVLEPENRATASYQHFLDYFWEQRVRPLAPSTALSGLVGREGPSRAQANRVLQSQLMALFSEQDVALEDVGTLALGTYAAALSDGRGPLVSGIARVFEEQTSAMLEEPGALLQVVSPLSLTPYGTQVALSGLSGESGRYLYEYLRRSEGEAVALLESMGAAWLAVRCAWLPWEAIERSDAYKEATTGRRPVGFIRSPESTDRFEDQRLAGEYQLCDRLLLPETYDRIASADPRLVAGRTFEDRLASAIDTASSIAGTLAWTLTGAVRVMTHLGVDSAGYRHLAEELTPYIQFLQHWIPSALGVRLVRDVVDRDSAIRVLRLTGDVTESEALVSLLQEHAGQLVEILGEETSLRVMHWAEAAAISG